MKELEEACSVIEQLNETIIEQLGNEQSDLITLSYNGNKTLIEFMGMRLWYSGEDMRNFNEDTNNYEPLKDYIKRVLLKEISKLYKLTL